MVKRQSDNYDVAKALSAALEPVIDVCLQIGITSPELESLLRATFVRRAFVRLPRQATTGRDPSDSRVSIATGVHRAEVSRIRGADGTTSARQPCRPRSGCIRAVRASCKAGPQTLSS
jgi:hypothetical protein